MKVRFIEVGRRKATWTEEIPKVTDSALIRAIRKKNVLMSSDIDVVPNESEDSGIIIVGGLRTVGTWEIIKEREEIAIAV